MTRIRRIDHKMLSGAIEQAQKTVESRNFSDP